MRYFYLLSPILVYLFVFLGVATPFSVHAKLPDDTAISQIGPPLHHPWGMSFWDDNHLIVSERRGKLFLISLTAGTAQEISHVPAVFHKRQGGLLDVLAVPKLQRIFICYSQPDNTGNARTAIVQAELSGTELTHQHLLFASNVNNKSGHHFGCRLTRDGDILYASLGERGKREMAQDPALQAGGIIGINITTKTLLPPAQENWADGMQTKGNRNPQGLALNPSSGELWMHEHGPKGGDEINIFTPGANYGWPITSFGREYYGARVGKGLTEAEGITNPIWHWTPSIAPSGMAFYTGNMFDFNGQLLVGSLKFRSLYLVNLDGNTVRSEQVLIKNQIGRIRDVEVAPDGSIYLLSDETQGGLYRLYRP